METFQRRQVGILCERLAEEPHHLIAIFGPRQTGKTTVVLQALRRTDIGSRYLCAEEAGFLEPSWPNRKPLPHPQSGTEWLVRSWNEARREAERAGRFILVLDEIQGICQWSRTVKGLWDADRWDNCPLHVVILGSTPMLMQSGLEESLLGRFETIKVTHWSFEEMSRAFGFSLDEYLYFGGYPGAAGFVRDPERWRSHILGAVVAPCIGRDVLSMTRVDKPGLLKRLFALGADRSGEVLSYTRMMGRLPEAGNTTTLARYLGLLSQVGLLAGFGKHSGKPYSIRKTTPKLNVLNTALMTAGSGYSFREALADRTFRGRLVESAVGAHLANTADYRMDVLYWRDGTAEVDFVLSSGRRVIPVEVRTGWKKERTKGTDRFEREFGSFRRLLVGQGGIPVHEFLAVPARRWFEKQRAEASGAQARG